MYVVNYNVIIRARGAIGNIRTQVVVARGTVDLT